MDSRRLSILRALDIDVWEPRTGADLQLKKTAARPNVEVLAGESRGTPIADTPAANEDVSFLDWPALQARVAPCVQCSLHKTRTQTVFGVGNRTAQWFVIGEAPGAEEDRQGEPFVGRAGQLLNSMLQAIGLKREDVFIANILKCRPPGNRDPQPDEVRSCIGYLQRQIELVNPRLILCVGRIAAQTLLQTDTIIGKLRGRVHSLSAPPTGKARPLIVTYHPAYLLRSPGEKRKTWQDLMLAMQTFDETGAQTIDQTIDKGRLP
jgi:uracil-DNA glycosylase family 4